MMALPLEGITVLDLTTVMAGPYCTMALGDMGADIIKVENFPEGDGSRRFEPKINDESYCFAVLNRNKKSIGINMKDPRGREIFMKLAAKADIITENFRPGVVKKLGIDYDTVKAFNPGVIYASMSGFGQTGPYGHKGGFDIVAQGMSGIMMMTGYPGGRPAKVGIAMNDISSGVTALYAILGCATAKASTSKHRCSKPDWRGHTGNPGRISAAVKHRWPPAPGIAARRRIRRTRRRTATSRSAPTTTSCGPISATSPATNRSG
jgi:crotonobetainyl-CoA:carnitine CoA-transferase CaiB-like acyl-CoA transferase